VRDDLTRSGEARHRDDGERASRGRSAWRHDRPGRYNRQSHCSRSGLCSYSDIKRSRRTKAAVASIRDGIRQILDEDHPQTVRQVFYALTVRGLIKKLEIEYQRTVIRLLVDMREAGDIPFGWIADNTRWQRKPTTYVGLDACLDATSKFYRRDLWAAMPVYVEVWCEKDALAGVLVEETAPYDVPLMVARGYSLDSGAECNRAMQTGFARLCQAL
jgi:hypothetical protein